MTIDNGSFEEAPAGGPEYDADGWSLAVVSSAEEYAEFAQGPGEGTLGLEQFTIGRGWGLPVPLIAAFAGLFDDLDPVTFGGLFLEGFDVDWGSGTQFLFGSVPYDPAEFGTSLDVFDGFEDDWPSPLKSAFVAADLDDALFNGADTFDDLEAGWGWPLIAAPTWDFAFFNDGPASLVQHEGFEGRRFNLTNVTADPSADTLETPAAHNLVNGWRIQVEVVGSGTLPGGLQADTFYFVRNVTATTFQVSNTLAGPIIDITSSGSGALEVSHDPAAFWIDEVTF